MGKDSELLHAVRNADVSTVRKFLVKFKSGPKGRKATSKKLQLNIPDEDGFTALHHAALSNNVEIVLALIEMESDPNSRDKKGMCPLHMAAWSGKDQIVKSLLENRALVNLPSFSGETPLLLASQHGYANVVEILMKFNADPTIRSNNLDSPLDAACQFGHTAVVRLLLMRGEVVHMLHQKQIDPRFKLPLHLAAKGGHVDVARLLIESGADVNKKTAQGTCLHLAALFGKVDVVKLLIEAGADAVAVNQKNMTPLDMVNEFTTSRAGIEIKQLLREATGEHVLFARATSDYINVYDQTCLQFKAGETITVLEQNENGRWKGSIFDGKVEKVGYFPATAVTIISNRKKASSTGSISSSSDSSLNSAASGKEGNMKSPSRVVDQNKPIGIVPVGTYEVLTLASSHSSETKKPPNIPRLNSFKKDTKTAASQRRKLNLQSDVNGDGDSSTRSSSADTSIDSGLHSNSSVTDTSYDTVPNSGKSPSGLPNVYDPLPPQIAKQPRIFPTNPPAGSSHFKPMEQRVSSSDEGTTHNHQQYADISFNRNDKQHQQQQQHADNPIKQPVPGYADVYIAEHQVSSPRLHSEAKPIPRSPHTANGQKEFRESYENMHFNKELLSKIGELSEHNMSPSAASRSQGYGGNQHESESVSSSSPMNFKNLPPSFFAEDEEMLPPSPPKKIESRAMNYRRKESYENIQPRNIVPVQVQNPFDNSKLGHKSAPSQPPQNNAVSNVRYENVVPPLSTLPARHDSAYENCRPPNSEPQKQRAATVAGKPSPLKPVPLPPKLSKINSQEPISPALPSPLGTVKTPFLSNLNLEGLNEDERELLNWLVELKLPQYYQNFEREGYDMVSVRGITPEDLTAIDITKAGHRKKLLSEVTKLGPSPKLPAHKPDDVGSWLKILGLCQYESNFLEGGFDEMDFIKDLDQSDLEMIEIKRKGHQKKLLLAVQKLSDVDLTAELDDFVGGTPATTATTATTATAGISTYLAHYEEQQQQQAQENLPPQRSYQQKYQQVDMLPKPSSADVISSGPINHVSGSAMDPLFPPPPSAVELEKTTFMLSHDDVQPPSEKESISNPPGEIRPRVVPAVPTRTASEKPKKVINPAPPPIRSRTSSSPVAPKPKPKPRPSQNMGQVRMASEYHGTESPSKSNVIVEETEVVSASRSRDFWLQSQQQQPQNELPPVRSKTISGIKPVLSPRPSSTSVSPRLETQDRSMSQNESSAIQVETRRASLKKVPPPAPPRRDSMPKKKDDSSNEMGQCANNEVGIAERSRTFSGPLDEKIRQAFRGNAQKGSAYAPISEKPLEEDVFVVTSPANTAVDNEMQETDSIMADIDDMIADFTSQLDSMFDEQ